MGMGADIDAKSLVVTKGLKAELLIVRPMVEEGGVNNWVAPKVQRGRQIFASLMGAAEDVGFQEDVPRLREASQGFALNMVGGRGVRLKVALEVPRDRLACVFLMAVGVVANIRDAQRVLRGVLCFARLMVEENVAYLLDAPKVLKVVRRCAKDMVGENVVFLMVVESVQKVFMVAQIFVLHMVAERGVLCQAAQRVHVAVLIAVLGMGEGSGASLKTVGRVHKVAQISVRPMVGASDALGERVNVRNLQGVRVVYVLHIAAWSRSGI